MFAHSPRFDIDEMRQSTNKQLKQNQGGFFAMALEAQTLSPTIPIKFSILICPVADPYKRASYLRSCINGTAIDDGHCIDPDGVHTVEKARFILEKQMSYWESDENMVEAVEVVTNRKHNVPTLVVVGSKDKNVPSCVTEDVRSWATRTVIIGGKGHELCIDIDETLDEYQCYMPDVERFLNHFLK
jgi:hypothetical protein